jgi:hypothetical protein
MESSLLRLLISSRSVIKLIGSFLKNLLLWNRFAKWTKTWYEASMEGSLEMLLIVSRSINKHVRHRHFLFLIGRFLKIFYSETAWPLMDQNDMSNLYRGPSIDSSYQVSYHLPILAKRFQRKSWSRNRPIRKKNCLWRPCLLTDQNGMSNSHRGPSIDVSYHVSVPSIEIAHIVLVH